MRVLHIISGLGDGGAEGVLFRLCGEIFPAHQAVVSLTGEGKYGPLLRGQGVTVSALGMNNWWSGLPGIFKLIRIIVAFRPDVVQTWMPHADLIGGLVAKFCGVKRIFWSIRATDYGSGFNALRTKLVVGAISVSSRFIPQKIVSCAEAAKISHTRLGYKANNIVVIPNGYELEQTEQNNSAKPQIVEGLELPPGTKLLGMVARFHPQKDHRNLFDALRILATSRKDFICLLAGSGIESSNRELREAILAAGVDKYVILLGRLEQPRKFMSALDLHVLSSSYGEGFPNVVAESMLMGVPNVSTDVGDVRTIIGETGWIVEPRNSRDLAEAISLGLSLTDNERTERGSLARKRVEEKFSVQKMMDSYKALYSSRTILQITRYGNVGASSRVRFDNFTASLISANFTIHRDSFFSDGYLKQRYSRRFPLASIVGSYLRRLALLWRARTVDILWIEKEIFPWLPWVFEKIFVPRKAKVVADYDDAVYLTYETHKSIAVRKLLGSKIRNVMHRSDLVLAGNYEIARYASRSRAKNVELFPTVVNVNDYQSAAVSVPHKSADAKVIIGWIGTPVTWRAFVVDKLSLLRDVTATTGAEFWAIGAPYEANDSAAGWIRFFPWSEETELQLLAEIDIGIMPLVDTPWARGKCGYKLLQHMAMASPVVASPVGVNSLIVSDGQNGYLASSDSEWTESLERLIQNPGRRKRMGQKALARVEESYDLERHTKNLVRFFANL